LIAKKSHDRRLRQHEQLPDAGGRSLGRPRYSASLNHPHIGAIYWLEESAGETALVLEYGTLGATSRLSFESRAL
jgi:hypothetical protein